MALIVTYKTTARFFHFPTTSTTNPSSFLSSLLPFQDNIHLISCHRHCSCSFCHREMAAKRLREEPLPDQPEGKRLRPSFTMIIKEAVVAKSIQSFCLALEPLVRKVVQEEVERGLVRRACVLPRSPQMFIEEARSSSSLQLIFKKPPSLPIFTENRIEDNDGNPLEILLVDSHTGKRPKTPVPTSIKVEIVVLDGDFPCDVSNNWSSAEFNLCIVKERRGRRPLLTGDIAVTLKDGAASIDELKFTDNSSWIRSRNFRIGVRVLPESQDGLSIGEAVTDPFVVKDHRGESYKKHYPPALVDEVWRLEKIGKDGVFHKRLAAESINTVQDFLKLSVVDAALLRKTLGMSDRNWEATINHARTCPLGEKLYVHQGPLYAIILNPICEVVRIEMNGISCTLQELSRPMRASVQEIVLKAYRCWDRLEEISLPMQGEQKDEVQIEPSYQIDGFLEVGFIQNDVQMGFSNWSPLMQNMLME